MTIRLLWIFPDRGSIRENRYDEERFWAGYRRVGAELDLDVDVVSAELIDVRLCDDDLSVWVDGSPATPTDTMFVTEYMPFPSLVRDAWSCTSMFALLEAAGFYLPVPPSYSLMANDKMLTMAFVRPLLRSAKLLPSARVLAGRDLLERDVAAMLASICDPPYIVKPASWANQMGLMEAHDHSELWSILRLASAADLPVIVQPRLPGHLLSAYKLYCVDGEVLGAELNTPLRGHVVTNANFGGSEGWVTPPTELVVEAKVILDAIPAAYVTLDFLHDGDQFYFSELEVDGSIAVYMLESPTALAILRRRFAAYRRDHHEFLARNEKSE